MIDPPSLPSPYLLTTKKISPAPHKKREKYGKKNLSIRKMLVNLHTHSKILLLQQKIIAKKCDFSFAYLPCCSPLDHSVQKDLKFDKKKDVNEIVIKKNIEKKKQARKFLSARAR